MRATHEIGYFLIIDVVCLELICNGVIVRFIFTIASRFSPIIISSVHPIKLVALLSRITVE